MEVLSAEDLARLWEENHMPAKRASGGLTEIIAHTSPALNPAYSGGTSRIVKLFTPSGRHIGTLHEIVMPDGTVPHGHPKDYTRRDCSRIRVGPGAETT